MQIKSRQFPHPVLSEFSDDIVDCEFQTPLIPTLTNCSYNFKSNFMTNCPELDEFVKTGTACFAVHIECSKTRFRQLFKFSEGEFIFSIPASNLDGKVEVVCLILAQADIPSYNSEYFHEDYAGFKFEIKKGDILAVGSNYSFEADKQNDDSKKLPSIFSIKPNNIEEAPSFDVTFGTDKIIILLSENNFSMYQMLRVNKDSAPIFFQMFIIPALIQVLEDIRNKAEDHEDLEHKRWYRVLSKKLSEMGYKISDLTEATDSSVAIAHKLMGEPLSLSLKAIDDIYSGGAYRGEE